MSADNGVYVLHTKKDGQYRVIHRQAIEDLYWSFIDKRSHNEFQPQRLLEFYKSSKATRNKELAERIAVSMERNVPICEYGVVWYDYLNYSWKQIVREGRKLLEEELAILTKTPESTERYRYDVEKIQQLLKNVS